MQRDTDTEADDPYAGDQWRDLEAELVEGDHHREEHDDQAQDPDGEHAQRRLHGASLQAPVDDPPQPAGDHRPHSQDDQRAQHLKAIANGEVEEKIGIHDALLDADHTTRPLEGSGGVRMAASW